MSKITKPAAKVLSLMKSKSCKLYAAKVTRYFKTGEGEYGYGDVFLGIKMPMIRSILSESHELLHQKDIGFLIVSKYHEVRMYGLLWLVKQYASSKSITERASILEFYCNHFEYVNNWDLVDCSAPNITGTHLLRDIDEETALKQLLAWCQNEHLWTRRIGVLSCLPFIREEIFEPILAVSKELLDREENHDLIHKASGWMLREMGKRNKSMLLDFLDENAERMPKVMLRYSVEKFPRTVQKKYLKRLPVVNRKRARGSSPLPLKQTKSKKKK
mmetsp:Transcript_24985/g.30529  ORF Transcript_24985/g.30529 Transcript_24985/m.30529 type:complete len:273 (+) Transcript_24985:101-919(+)